MAKRIKKTAAGDSIELDGLVLGAAIVEEYGIPSTSGTTKSYKDKELTSYPSPRSFDIEYLKSRQEASALMPVYKEEIVRALKERQERQKGRLSDSQAIKEIEDKIIVIQDGNAGTILSTLSHSATGVTMDRVLRFIPELLYRENSRLRTLSQGTAYRAISPKEDTQLSLFVETEEKSLPTTDTAILKYSSREWAKMIYNKSNPRPNEEEYIERVVEQLSQTKIYYPLGGGKYAYAPLIWRSNTGVLDTQDADGLSFEYIKLNPLFTLALTESKGKISGAEVVWHAPIRAISSLLTKPIEYRLLNKLELLYSYAHSAIKEKASKGEIEEHSEDKEKLLSIVSTADLASLKKNKSRIVKDLLTAFAKMEQIGIIAEGTFREKGKSYIWGWNPEYFKR